MFRKTIKQINLILIFFLNGKTLGTDFPKIYPFCFQNMEIQYS